MGERRRSHEQNTEKIPRNILELCTPSSLVRFGLSDRTGYQLPMYGSAATTLNLRCTRGFHLKGEKNNTTGEAAEETTGNCHPSSPSLPVFQTTLRFVIIESSSLKRTNRFMPGARAVGVPVHIRPRASSDFRRRRSPVPSLGFRSPWVVKGHRVAVPVSSSAPSFGVIEG